jgi:NAD(P)-dependent dehydrogenase (short-subunit alcohol dehydrogenase family)
VIEATPLRRWGGAAEIAKTILFLVDSDFITGECTASTAAGISFDCTFARTEKYPT